MKARTRFIKSIVEAARTEEVQMPWTRGATRAASIRRRTNASERRNLRTA